MGRLDGTQQPLWLPPRSPTAPLVALQSKLKSAGGAQRSACSMTAHLAVRVDAGGHLLAADQRGELPLNPPATKEGGKARRRGMLASALLHRWARAANPQPVIKTPTGERAAPTDA